MLHLPVEKYKKDIIRTLKKLIAYESVKTKSELNMPYGKGIFGALMFMLDEAERMDMHSVNLFGHAGYAEYGSGDQTLAILVHLDVVPAGAGWDTPAFEGVEKDGKIYGRGAVDNKGPAVAALYALYALKESCASVNKKVRIIFGCDEESTWEDMDYYKKTQPMPDMVITPDAHFPIINTEKGLLQLKLTKNCSICENELSIKSIESGERPNVVPGTASCVINAPYDLIFDAAMAFNEYVPAHIEVLKASEGARICVTGEAAHGSTPEKGINALSYLIAFLNTLPLADGDIENFVYALASLIGLDTTGQSLGIDASDEICGALTLNLGSLRVAEGKIEAQVDIRFPMCTKPLAIINKLTEQCQEYDIELEVLKSMDAHHIPEDSELVMKLKKVYEACFGQTAQCLCSGGATYARAFDKGVAFGPIAIDAPSVEHQPNEYIEIDALIKLAEVLVCAISELAQATMDQ